MNPNDYKEAVRLASAGELQSAELLCNQLLQQTPSNYQLIYLACSINLLQKKYEESRTLCMRLLGMNDKNPDVYNLLAAISSEHDKNDEETEKWLKLALKYDPDNPKVLVNLANLKFFSGNVEAAKVLFEQATSPTQPNPDALNGLAMIATRMGDHERAAAGYKQALELDPSNTAALSNLISGLYKVGRKDEAIHFATYAASMKFPGASAVPAFTVTKTHCLLDEAEVLLPHAIEQLRMLPADPTLYSFSSLAFLSSSSIGNEQLFDIHCQAGTVIRRSLESEPYQDHNKAFASMAPIKIGYLSSDFNAHVLGHFFRGLINYRDRDNFEIYMYSNISPEKEDNITDQYRMAVDHYTNVYALSDKALAQRIHDDGVHILVELNGHTGTGVAPRLPVLAYRPSPVQIAYLNYPYTYGLDEVDYVISDPWLNGTDNARFFSEQPLELPRSFLTIGDYFEREISSQPPRLRNGFITFGSLNNIYKYNRKVIELWSKVLHQVAGSRIYLNHPALSMEVSRKSLISEFTKNGISSDRIDLVWERHPSGSHLRYYNEFDISLDTMPLTGGTTTVDALWMAVPVVTLVGECHAQRLSYSIINNSGINMEDCIAFTEEDYVQKAVNLAFNPKRLDELRMGIPSAMRNSILCDPVTFTKDVEALYIQSWNKKFNESKIGEAMNQSSTLTLPLIKSSGKIVVHDDSWDMYKYILQEQGWWFEPETDFLITVAAKFACFWDIANDPGVISIPAAQKQIVGGGRTYAFRSTTEMSDLLQQSILENELDNLYLADILHSMETPPDLVRFSLDFNDGEGGLIEQWLENIGEASPLVMVSLRNAQGSDLSAMPTMAAAGYQSYRLLHGFDLLVPHKFGDPMYASDINLFFCKPDRAEKLELAGLLSTNPEDIDQMPTAESMQWSELLASFPYTSSHLALWLATPVPGKWSEMYLTFLNLYAEAKNRKIRPAQRYARLQLAETIISLLIESEATAPRLMSGMRLMLDIGNREKAIQFATILQNGMQGLTGSLLDEPFLMPEQVFEHMKIEADEVEWTAILAAVCRERLSRFSTWFTGDASLPFWRECTHYPWFNEMATKMVNLISERYQDEKPRELVGHISSGNIH